MHDDTFRRPKLKKRKGESRLNFLFLLDQNLKKIPLNLDIEDLSTSIADSIIESVNKFPPSNVIIQSIILIVGLQIALKMQSISETNCFKNGCPIQPMKIIVYTKSNAIMLQRLFVLFVQRLLSY